MSKYLLASDFDGTLIHWPNPEISEYDRDAIKRFREAGNIFVVVTGRNYEAAMMGFESVGFKEMDAFLCLSGAYCGKLDGSEIFDRRQKNIYKSEFVDFFKKNGARYLNLDIGENNYHIDIGTDYGTPFNRFSYEEGCNIEEFTSYNAGFNSVDEATEAAKKISELFGDMVTPLQNGQAVDMPPAGINKAVGAKNAAEMFNVELDKIYTVGDNFNDMDMIKAFHGSAMIQAPEIVKKCAERTVNYVGEIIDYIMEEI